MTTQQTVKERFREGSVMGIGASVGCAVLFGYMCTLFGVPAIVQGTVTAGAAGLPAAIEYSIQGRRRNKTEDSSRIARGELRRPIGLVAAMLAAALLLVDTIIGAIAGVILQPLALTISDDGAQMLGWLVTLVAAVGGLLVSSYASHYLGERPYLWTAVAVGAVFVLRVLIILMVFGVDPLLAHPARIVEGFLTLLVACEAGVWFGRRHHDQFLAKKLARAQHKALRAKSTLIQTSPTDPPPANADAPSSPEPRPDLLEQLKKLGDLWNTGVLSEDEFLAKKAEILARI